MKASDTTSRRLANPFAGFPQPPTQAELNKVLGSSKVLWQRLLGELARDLKLTTTEWNTSSPRRGWSFRVKQGDRIIIYLSPLEGAFHACFVLRDKALRAALASDLPPAAIERIGSASKCAAGTGVRMDVHNLEDIAVVKKLAEAKLKN